MLTDEEMIRRGSKVIAKKMVSLLKNLPFLIIKWLYKLIKELFFKFFGPFRVVIEYLESFVKWFFGALRSVFSFFGININF
jgi:hypothetical protein